MGFDIVNKSEEEIKKGKLHTLLNSMVPLTDDEIKATIRELQEEDRSKNQQGNKNEG